MNAENDFMLRLKETFRGEADEHLAALSGDLDELEAGKLDAGGRAAVAERFFREAHSLKGAARAVELHGIERICQATEDIFYSLKKGQRELEPGTYAALRSAIGLMGTLARADSAVADPEIRALLELLAGSSAPPPDCAAAAAEAPKPPRPRKEGPSMSETIRVPAKRLGAIFLKAEEMLSVKHVMASHSARLRELAAVQDDWTRTWHKVRLKARALRARYPDDGELQGLVDHLDGYADHSLATWQALDDMGTRLDLERFHTGERVAALLSEVKSALMLPFSTLLESFPRMVKDLAAEENKEAAWSVRGDDTEIDRRVLEAIKDPLVHIVRNSVSHGIENPDLRERRGKAREGAVSLSVERLDHDTLEFTVSDDGAGIDVDQVKASALKLGLLEETAAPTMARRDALGLIFLSDLSTSPMITDISGRGLGLAIARERIEAIGGSLSVQSASGRGTSFRIRIPLSLSTFRGVIVICAGRKFVVPTESVDQVLRVARSSVTQNELRRCVAIGGRAVSLVDLSELLCMGPASAGPGDEGSLVVLVLEGRGSRVALAIDGVLGEQEVLTKGLGSQLVRVRNVSGATVLPGGELVPILNPGDLFKSALSAEAGGKARPSRAATDDGPRRVLVADDSVTSRMLLKTMLETAGYEVVTSVDGVEAFSLLRTDSFDLLVSDIDMPRMDGIELCSRIRAHEATADLPIVLVTSLDSREDKERGIDAGANAFIAKSSFDQSNLLDVVARLV